MCGRAELTWLGLVGSFEGLQGSLHALVCYLASTGAHCLQCGSRWTGEVPLKTCLCCLSSCVWWRQIPGQQALHHVLWCWDRTAQANEQSQPCPA